MALKVEEKLEEIKDDISQVDRHVGQLSTTLLDVAGKLTSSYEQLLKQQEKNNEQDRRLSSHKTWLILHSVILFFLAIILIAYFPI